MTHLPLMQVRALGVLLALTALSCGGSAEPAAAPESTDPSAASQAPTAPVDGPALTATSSRGTFAIAITPKGGPIPTNEPFDVELDVTDPSTGDPLVDFDAITLDARMPAHDHGMTRDVELVATDTPGRFTADGLLFHMIGHWEFHVDVTRGPRIERAQASTTLQF